MAVAAKAPLKDQGDKMEAISAGNRDGGDGLVAAHLSRAVRGGSTMDSDQDGISSPMDKGRQRMKHDGSR